MKNEEKKDEILREELDFNKPDYIFKPEGNHDWRQQGYYIVCKSCELQHASFIGSEKILVGHDEKGNPILKKRKEIGLI